MKKLLIVALGVSALFCAGADMPVNGNFETPVNADGSIPGWTVEKAVVVKGLKGNCLEITPTDKHGKSMMRGSIRSRIRDFTPGKKYMLSGICRNADALWIVVMFDWKNNVKPVRVWLGKNKFRDYDETDWKSFSIMVDVPENAAILNVVIEPVTSKDTPKVYLDEIKLEKLN